MRLKIIIVFTPCKLGYCCHTQKTIQFVAMHRTAKKTKQKNNNNKTNKQKLLMCGVSLMVYLRLSPNTSWPLSDCITYMAKNKPVNSIPSKLSLMLTKVIKLDSNGLFGLQRKLHGPCQAKTCLNNIS